MIYVVKKNIRLLEECELFRLLNQQMINMCARKYLLYMYFSIYLFPTVKNKQVLVSASLDPEFSISNQVNISSILETLFHQNFPMQVDLGTFILFLRMIGKPSIDE